MKLLPPVMKDECFVSYNACALLVKIVTGQTDAYITGSKVILDFIWLMKSILVYQY